MGKHHSRQVSAANDCKVGRTGPRRPPVRRQGPATQAHRDVAPARPGGASKLSKEGAPGPKEEEIRHRGHFAYCPRSSDPRPVCSQGRSWFVTLHWWISHNCADVAIPIAIRDGTPTSSAAPHTESSIVFAGPVCEPETSPTLSLARGVPTFPTPRRRGMPGRIGSRDLARPPAGEEPTPGRLPLAHQLSFK